MHLKKLSFRLKFLLAALCIAVWAPYASAEQASPRNVNNPIVRIVREVSPAIVNIDVETTARRQEATLPFQNDPFFRRFFRGELERFTRPAPTRGRGSGFIVSADGIILTNNHVVDGTNRITVTMADGSEYEAEIIGRDPTFDLAVIQITPTNELPVLELGDSDLIEVGEWVVAIGNPYGFGHTVTVGVISAMDRAVHGRNVNFDGFIQTDASINPGNSGGPLIDMYGKVIGINTAIIPFAQGIGFAIPVNMAKQIMDDLITHGRVRRGWLGISVQSLTEEFAEAYGIEGRVGVIVGDVFEDSAAERYGLQRGDVIVAINGEPVEGVHWFVNRIRTQAPYDELTLTIIRASNTIDLTLTLGEMPYTHAEATPPADTRDNVLRGIGLSVSSSTTELRRQFNIGNVAGLVITEVVEGSQAQRLGLRAGDLVLEVNGTRVNEPSDADGAVRSDATSLVLLIERDGRTFFTSLRLE